MIEPSMRALIERVVHQYWPKDNEPGSVCNDLNAELTQDITKLCEEAASKAFSATAYAFTHDLGLKDLDGLRASVVKAVIGGGE